MRYINEKFILMNKRGLELAWGWLDDGTKDSILEKVNIPEGERQNIVDETIVRKVPLLDETHELLNNAATLTIPEVFLKNTDIVKELQRLGILNEDRSVVESTHLFDKYKRYIEVLNFIWDVERNPDQTIVNQKQLVDNYLYITSEASNDLIERDRKVNIQIMYATAIYNDIIRNGGLLLSDPVSWNYRVENTSASIKEYDRCFDKDYARNVFDVAIISSIFEKDPNLSNKDIVGQESLIIYILGKYGIESESGGPIKPKYLKLEKPNVLNQITVLLKSGNNTQKRQELLFLQNYIWPAGEKWNYENRSYNRALFKNLNKYTAFTKEKALIKAIPELANPEQISDQGFAEIMGKFAKENQFGALWIALFSWLLGYKEVALGSALFWVFAPSLLKTGWELVSKASQSMNDDDLELVDQQDIIYSLEDITFQPWYEKLALVNKTNRVNQRDETTHRALPSLDNKTLFSLVETITENSIDINMRWLTSAKLLTKIQAHTTAFKKEQLKAFIGLLQSENFEHDTEDRTILDYLYEGKDILNIPYEDVSFTNLPDIDDKINTALKAKWELTNVTRIDRLDTLEMKKIIWAEFSNISRSLDQVKTFFTWKWWENATDMPSFDFELDTSNIIDSLGQIDTPLSKLLKPILIDYDNYLQKEKKLAEYTGVFDENIDTSQAILYSVLGLGTIKAFDISVLETATDYTRDKEIANKSRLWIAIDGKINELKKLKTVWKSPIAEPFLTQNKNIDTLITNLEKVRDAIMIDIQWSNGAHVPQQNNAAILSQYKWSISRVRETIDTHMRGVESFSVDGSIDDLLESLEDLQIPYSELVNYKKALGVIPAPSNNITRDQIDLAIKSSLANFQNKKAWTTSWPSAVLVNSSTSQAPTLSNAPQVTMKWTSIESLVSTKLENYYKEISDIKQNVDKVDVIDVTKLKDSLTALQAAKAYIDWKNTTQWSLWGLVVSRTTTQPWGNTVSLVSFNLGATRINIDYAFDVIDADKKLSNAIGTSKEIFGNQFSVTWNINDPLKSLQTEYESKIEGVKKLAVTYVESVDIATNKVIETSLLLRQIRDAYGTEDILFYRVVTKKLEEIAAQYIKRDIQNDPGLIVAIEEDIVSKNKEIQQQQKQIQQLQTAPNAPKNSMRIQALKDANKTLRNAVTILENMKNGTGTILDEWSKALSSFWEKTKDYFDTLWVSLGLFENKSTQQPVITTAPVTPKPNGNSGLWITLGNGTTTGKPNTGGIKTPASKPTPAIKPAPTPWIWEQILNFIGFWK